MNNKKSTNTSSQSGNHKNNMAKKIAMGATGVAITAGVVAAGVALSNPRTREKLGKSIKKGAKALQEVMKDSPMSMGNGKTQKQMKGKSKTSSHKMSGTKAKSKSTKGRKTNEKMNEQQMGASA